MRGRQGSKSESSTMGSVPGMIMLEETEGEITCMVKSKNDGLAYWRSSVVAIISTSSFISSATLYNSPIGQLESRVYMTYSVARFLNFLVFCVTSPTLWYALMMSSEIR